MKRPGNSLKKMSKKPWVISMENVFLIGFMGCGKSTVAEMLERRCGMHLIEMDQLIEEENQMKISDIFANKGEEYFRDLETNLIHRVCSEQGQVISCGGGVVLREENVSSMKKSGKIILLTATPETILTRVAGDETRPILKDKKSVHDIEMLMGQRKQKYEMAADFSVATDEKTVSQICEEIILRMKGIGE